jgi:hypothetical protein
MAGRIKRDLEKHARLESDKATRSVAAAEAARAIGADVDTRGPDDADKLQADLEFAIGEHSRLKATADSINQRLLAAESARTKLEASQTSYSGISVEAAKGAELAARESSEAANAEVAKLTDLLAQARGAATMAQMQHENSMNALRVAVEHEQTVTAWREAIDAAANVEPIDATVIAESEADVLAAREALLRGDRIRQAKLKAAEADEHMRQAAEFRRVSDWLRDCAHATDEVLSDMVSKLGCPLSVSGGRLMTVHPVRGTTFYSELSDGERWKIALDIAIAAVGPNGVLTVKQDAWQDLDPNNQQLIIDHVAATDVTLYTAECDAGELRAEVA